jgi:membrane protein YqaA with SNARE-associated domain
MPGKKPESVNGSITKSRWFGVGVLGFSLTMVALPLLFASRLKDLKTFGYAGIFLLNFLGSATVLIPSTAIMSVGVGGSLYNPFVVALISSLGSSLGEVVGYGVGYSSEKIANLRRYKRVYKAFTFLFDKSGELAVFVIAFIPNPFFDVIGIFAGISRFSLPKFLVIVFVARFLRDVIIASTGAFLGG